MSEYVFRWIIQQIADKNMKYFIKQTLAENH
jgi:hypothetical protein